MNILTIDIGGTNVKMLATGQHERRKFPSGKTLTPDKMVAGVKEATKDWQYDVVTVGYPGLVRHNKIIAEPANIGQGWLSFDLARAFGRPVKIMNDGAMQAYGSYAGGTQMFIGLGTGVGAAFIVDGTIVPLELGHLPFRKGSLEQYLGRAGMQRLGKKRWQKCVDEAVARFIVALRPEDVVIGGGNAKKLLHMPPGCRLGHNFNAFVGGYRVWEEEAIHILPVATLTKAMQEFETAH